MHEDGPTNRQTLLYLDEKKYVQDFGFPLSVLLPQNQDVQQADPYALAHLCQPSLEFGHGVDSTLTILHHLGEQQSERADAHFCFGPSKWSLKNSGLPFGEPSLHLLLG